MKAQSVSVKPISILVFLYKRAQWREENQVGRRLACKLSLHKQHTTFTYITVHGYKTKWEHPEELSAPTPNGVDMEHVTLSSLWLASTSANYLILELPVGFLCRGFKKVSSGIPDIAFFTPQKYTPEHLSFLRIYRYLC